MVFAVVTRATTDEDRREEAAMTIATTWWEKLGEGSSFRARVFPRCETEYYGALEWSVHASSSRSLSGNIVKMTEIIIIIWVSSSKKRKKEIFPGWGRLGGWLAS